MEKTFNQKNTTTNENYSEVNSTKINHSNDISTIPIMKSNRDDFQALALLGYRIGKKIGKGSYGSVLAVKYITEDNSKSINLACKIIDKRKAANDFLEKFFPRELEILSKLDNHPYIIEIYSIIERGPKILIFMRYAENGDLLKYIKKNGPIRELKCKLWFSQIIKAIKYLHSNDIAHRDLKCENILISKNMNIKIADFGFARYCNKFEKKIFSQTYCGSAAYASPEIVHGIPYDPKLADIWSLGIILFIMLNAKMPFDDNNLIKLYENQKNKNYYYRKRLDDVISIAAKKIINALLEPIPAKRCNLNTILNTKWINEFDVNEKQN